MIRPPPRSALFPYTTLFRSNCTAASAPVTITEPAVLTVSASAGTILCSPGSTTITALDADGTRGYPNYTKIVLFHTCSTFTGATPGVYTVTVKDDNNCTAASALVTIADMAVLTVSAVEARILCSSGSTTITALGAGGTGGYQYSTNGVLFQTSATFTGATPGRSEESRVGEESRSRGSPHH